MKKILFSILLPAAAAFAEGEAFEPTSKEQLDAFYSKSGRSVAITVRTKQQLHTVNPAFLGINLSYFNTTDDIWEQYNLQGKLKKAGTKALCYGILGMHIVTGDAQNLLVRGRQSRPREVGLCFFVIQGYALVLLGDPWVTEFTGHLRIGQLHHIA